ncbi:hypothetical protein BJV82DRAFT_669023 [Fennellomyces sp. T-0311]|nr:hypothetical protein BJV82DRAFT_669023 [Fennellomyces sp. T-0311]
MSTREKDNSTDQQTNFETRNSDSGDSAESTPEEKSCKLDDGVVDKGYAWLVAIGTTASFFFVGLPQNW